MGKQAWKAIIRERSVPHVGSGGPTAAHAFWRLTLACGHEINRTDSTRPRKRARCFECERQDASPSTRGDRK